MADSDEKALNQRYDPAADWGISEEELAAFRSARAEWNKGAPEIGSEAPDFEVERLDAKGRRTGEMFRLSSTRDRPVALVMGSYT